ncbi:cytochrome c biogenesis CcdA family protein [Paractinoplanes lichenicola]|uniref:Cytochrome c biogenesis protein CcdA n=1 Tax=Paractinoplanes lichenicola TaxID=2802976 RepID=A0ABS1VV70_9ACTN|nr:cytochrome c biogenesis protein CcdA [Actinoplanes lichenicola]MBL7258360.1 cytochrome c biogenesis protein CcdA [Actinoplanes lichenicola]
MGGELLLALTAGMLGAVNPCGFALLPAYLSVLVATEPGRPARAVGRALKAGAALALGYAVVFGAFGLLLTPIAGALQPRLPWLTVVLGLGLAALGGWLLAGRSLPAVTVRAPVLTGSTGSTVLFGMAYAVASLGCAVGPFLALVVSSLRAGSIGAGVALFLAYAGGMALVVSATAVAVALVRVSVITRIRGLLGLVPRLGGAILVVCGLYVAYYGWYELRLAGDLRLAGTDPVINAAAVVQRWLSSGVSSLGAWPFVIVVAAALVVLVVLTKKRPARGGPFSSEGVADQRVRRPAGTR